MPRFLKGTLDHDGDGRMGGSRKASDMTAKKTEKPKAASKPRVHDNPDEAGSNDPASDAIFRHPEHKED